MPQCCIVPMCNSRTSGHRFPSDTKLKAAWLLAINRDNYEPSKNARICNKHFLPTDYSMPLESVVANLFEMPLNNAEKCKNYRNRKKEATLKIKKTSLTSAERSRMYRLRKKQLTQGIKSSVNEVSYTPSTSNSRMTFEVEPSPQPVTTARPRLKKDAIPTQFYWTKPTAVMAKGAFKYHGRAMIARVYHFLQKEYEFLKARLIDVDLSPLANILQRTAEATGVSEQTVTHILDEEQVTKDSLVADQAETLENLDHNYHTNERSKGELKENSTDMITNEESYRCFEDYEVSDEQPERELTAELMMKCEVVFEDEPIRQEDKNDEENTMKAYAYKRRKMKTEPDDEEHPKSSSHQRRCSRSPVRVKTEPADDTCRPSSSTVYHVPWDTTHAAVKTEPADHEIRERKPTTNNIICDETHTHIKHEPPED